MPEKKEENTAEEEITSEDMIKFAGKLEAWGHTLPDKEQVLLQIILALAHDAPKDAKTRLELGDFEKLAKKALQGMEEQTLMMRQTWVRMGPGIWVRWSSRSL